MSLFASALRIRTAGTILLLLAGGITPVMFAQTRTPRGVVRVETDGSSYLGIQMEDVTASNMAQYKLTSERGVIVRSVDKGSPAEAAGLQENDVITDYAGMPVLSTMQLARMVRETPVGRKVEITVSRGGKKAPLTAEIGKREGLDRGATIMPWGGEGRGFEFFGPDGRSFQFHTPGGKGFMFDVPGMNGPIVAFGKPKLGVTLEPLTDQMAQFLGVQGKKGVLVTSVDQGSPAAGKLKAGDVITQADKQSLDSPDDLARIVRDKSDGKIDLTIVRDKKELTLSVDLPKADQSKSTRGYRL